MIGRVAIFPDGLQVAAVPSTLGSTEQVELYALVSFPPS
ncbi:hypothetical protein GGQ12_002916 [Salinibacter ruber]|nr:hypothetical protein [Salinibacter ruber]